MTTTSRKKVYSISGPLKDRFEQHGIHVSELVLYVNSSCNLRCKHCYVGDALLDRSVRLDPLSAKGLIGEFAPLDRITILGGEPFLYKSINDLISQVVVSPIRERRITTNLTDFFFFDVSRFKGAPLRISISLDGHDKASHEEIRGRGTFDRTIRNLAILVEADYDVEITHTVTKKALPHIFRLIEFLRSLGVRRLNLHKISMQGNANDNKDLFVTPCEWIDFLSELEARSRGSGSVTDIELRYPVLYATKEALISLFLEGKYNHHASGSFYSHERGARVVFYPDQRLYISSELFGTGSYIGRVEDGSFVYNDSPINELEFFSRSASSEKTIEMLNPIFADQEKKLTPLSVSFKQKRFI